MDLRRQESYHIKKTIPKNQMFISYLLSSFINVSNSIRYHAQGSNCINNIWHIHYTKQELIFGNLLPELEFLQYVTSATDPDIVSFFNIV